MSEKAVTRAKGAARAGRGTFNRVSHERLREAVGRLRREVPGLFDLPRSGEVAVLAHSLVHKTKRVLLGELAGMPFREVEVPEYRRPLLTRVFPVELLEALAAYFRVPANFFRVVPLADD